MTSSRLRIASFVALVLAYAAALAGQPKHKPPAVPPACSACTAGGINRVAITDFRYAVQKKKLISYALPHISTGADSPRDEPWLLELLVDFSGHVCGTTLIRGEEVRLISALKTSMLEWLFTPNQYCYRMRVFAYIRAKDGRTRLIVPGLPEEGE